ncbi:MAG: HU family DNA-binding protein [Bryobacterales bacterium]|nr:HU family DNA-binding protein [Bryobacterales bacterium]
MRKTDLAIRLARDGRVTAAQAADQLDRAVDEILKAVRSGKPASLPGLGRFLPGAGDTITFEKTPAKPVEPKRD